LQLCACLPELYDQHQWSALIAHGIEYKRGWLPTYGSRIRQVKSIQ
jgi:hypothetical protein